MKDLSQATVDKAAAAIANARGGRRGAPAIVNVLDILPPKLKQEVREDAEDALKAVGVPELIDALQRFVDLHGLEYLGSDPRTAHATKEAIEALDLAEAPRQVRS